MFKKIVTLSLSVLTVCVMTNSQAQSGRKYCESVQKYVQEQSRLGKSTYLVGIGYAPFTNKTPFGEIDADLIFRANAGYYCDSESNFPTLYAQATGYTVVGVGYERKFAPDQLKEATEDYERLIKAIGYFDFMKSSK
jgi:hypothetical protein